MNKRVIKLSRNGDESGVYVDKESINQAFVEISLMFETDEIGDFYTVTLEEMDEDEFNNLPFDLWQEW